MSTIKERKIIITKPFLTKFIYLAERRVVRAKVRDSKKSLTYCRDIYWKKYPRYYQRIGKAIAQAVGMQSLKSNADYADYLDKLTDGEIQLAIDKMKVKLTVTLPKVITPSPVSTPVVEDSRFHGTANHHLTPSSMGGGYGANSAPGTTIVPDLTPAGFTDTDPWINRPVHVVDTERQVQLQMRLRQALMSISQCRVVRDQEDGDLDTDRLTDIGAGVNLTGVFAKNIVGKRLSTAVQIYADISGSMHDGDGSNGQRQLRLCVTLGTVLEKLKIPLQVIAYDSDTYLVKGWQTKLNTSMIWKMPLSMGGTTLVKSLATGFPELAARREERKVAVIISDGDIGTTSNAPTINMVDSASGETWTGKEPATIAIRKQFPAIETCFFGIGEMKIPDCAFDYKLCGLGANIVEEVASKVVKVIVGE